MPMEALAADFDAFTRAAGQLGIADNPLGLITSLPLPVVPRFRPTDLGLVDVERQELILAFEFLD
jgi:adenine deaminase